MIDNCCAWIMSCFRSNVCMGHVNCLYTFGKTIRWLQSIRNLGQEIKLHSRSSYTAETVHAANTDVSSKVELLKGQ